MRTDLLVTLLAITAVPAQSQTQAVPYASPADVAQAIARSKASASVRRLDSSIASMTGFSSMTTWATISPRLRRLRAKRARQARCFLARSSDGSGARLCIIDRAGPRLR